jgi:prepilin-type N-terminal cleavage/methylation domain-containing protein
MKMPKSNFIVKNYNASAGFTLVELLVSIAIMGITASLISYAIGSMISSNQSLAKEQNRRVEISRALDLMATDIRQSQVLPVTDAPSSLTGTGATNVLYMKLISATCTGADDYKNGIVYSIKAKSSTDKTAIGPNIIYRYGLIPDSTGAINCSDTPSFTTIADAVSLGTMTPPVCNATSTPTSPPSGVTGFYTCSSDQQVSIALFAKFSDTKTYAVSQSTTSGYIPNVTTTDTLTCTVPNLGGGTTSAQTTTAANTAIDSAQLLRHGINTESGGNKVLTQNPPKDTKMPCNKGLVTYTY